MPKTLAVELQELSDSLEKEFCEIRDNERVEEIFEGLYIYDSSLPIPSTPFLPHPLRSKGGFKHLPPKAIS